MEADMSRLMLDWYDAHKRDLPFRGTHDPYRVWVSEIMLQQTRTETVGAYYLRFLSRFPSVQALAEAPEEDVLKMWEGLGYYSRARNLHKAARIIVSQYGGVFPASAAELERLPGIGAYTAAAVASIAFGEAVPAVDGNLTRVLARVHGVRQDTALPSVKRLLYSLGKADMPAGGRCGDLNQALMDLGASVCVPGTPDCAACPLRCLCDAYRAGDAEELPVHTGAKPPKELSMAVPVVFCGDTVYLLQREESLLHGLWAFPVLENAGTKAARAKALRALGIRAEQTAKIGDARHIFTHRVWNMVLYHYECTAPLCGKGRFVTAEEMRALPLPTAVRAAKEYAEKVLEERSRAR